MTAWSSKEEETDRGKKAHKRALDRHAHKEASQSDESLLFSLSARAGLGLPGGNLVPIRNSQVASKDPFKIQESGPWTDPCCTVQEMKTMAP